MTLDCSHTLDKADARGRVLPDKTGYPRHEPRRRCSIAVRKRITVLHMLAGFLQVLQRD